MEAHGPRLGVLLQRVHGMVVLAHRRRALCGLGTLPLGQLALLRSSTVLLGQAPEPILLRLSGAGLGRKAMRWG